MSAAAKRTERRCRKPARGRYRDLARGAAARRRRNALSAVLGLTACPAFVAGLWAVGDGRGAGWGAAGTVLAVALLKASERAGGWMP